MFFPNPNDITQALDAATGDLLLGVSPARARGRRRVSPASATNRNLAIYGNLILDNGADGYAYALDARTGELVWETFILDYRTGAKHSSGPIVANGKVVSGRSCEPEGGPEACVITAFDAKTGKEIWRTAHDPEAGRARRRNLGRRALREALARRLVDGAELRSRAEPHLRRHVGDVARAEVHARRQRRAAPLPQLDARARRGHGRDRLVLPASRRSLGSRPSVRAPAARYGSRARSEDAVQWINPRVRSGEVRKVITGIPGKTGLVYTLDRATGQFLWARETTVQNVIGTINVESGAASESRHAVHGAGPREAVCPARAAARIIPPARTAR